MISCTTAAKDTVILITHVSRCFKDTPVVSILVSTSHIAVDIQNKKKNKMENSKYGCPMLRIFWNSLRSIKSGSGQFFQTKEAFKMDFGILSSIRVF